MQASLAPVRDSDCPDYYKLADGRQFYEFSAGELTTTLWQHGIVGWPYHCAISALEHLFRMGAKAGETDTDAEAFAWWWQHVPDTLGRRLAYDMTIKERRKVGRT